MAQQKGSTSKLIIGFESTFKTSPVDGYNLPFNTCGLRANRAKNAAATITGRRDPVKPFDGNLNCSGPIVVPVDSDAMPYWLAAMLGDPTTTGSDPYEHEYKIANIMPSISIEKQFADLATPKYELFNGCKIAGFSMEVGGDGELVANLDVFGAKQTMNTSAFDATPTDVTLDRVNNFEASIEEGGVALTNATALSLNVDFGLDQNQYVIGGAGELGGLPEGIVAVSGNLKTLFESDALLTKALNSTETSIKLTVTASANSIFEVEIEELQFERNSPDIPGPQGLIVDMNFQGYFDNGSESSAVVFRVTNNIASYDLAP